MKNMNLKKVMKLVDSKMPSKYKVKDNADVVKKKFRDFLSWYDGNKVDEVDEAFLKSIGWDYLENETNLSLKEVANIFNNNLDKMVEFTQEDIGNAISIDWDLDGEHFSVDSIKKIQDSRKVKDGYDFDGYDEYGYDEYGHKRYTVYYGDGNIDDECDTEEEAIRSAKECRDRLRQNGSDEEVFVNNVDTCVWSSDWEENISDSRKVKDSASLSDYDEMDWGTGEEYYIPKQTTKVYLNDDEDNEKEVDVWVAIKTTDLAEFMREDEYTENDRFIVEVICVPTSESLSEETRGAVSEGDSFEPNIADIDSYGYSVSFWYKQCSESEVMSAQEEAAEKAEGFKAMIGFALDKPYNRMGDDGWSILEDACLNKKPNWRR